MFNSVDFNRIQTEDVLPQLTRLVGQDKINQWADVVGDHNPLHVDPEYAHQTKFKSTIAHGPLVISFISEMMGNWLGPGWIEGGKLLDVRFRAPVKSGDKITIQGQVVDKRIVDGLQTVECRVFVENQEGAKVVEGRAIGQVE